MLLGFGVLGRAIGKEFYIWEKGRHVRNALIVPFAVVVGVIMVVAMVIWNVAVFVVKDRIDRAAGRKKWPD